MSVGSIARNIKNRQRCLQARHTVKNIYGSGKSAGTTKAVECRNPECDYKAYYIYKKCPSCGWEQ